MKLHSVREAANKTALMSTTLREETVVPRLMQRLTHRVGGPVIHA